MPRQVCGGSGPTPEMLIKCNVVVEHCQRVDAVHQIQIRNSSHDEKKVQFAVKHKHFYSEMFLFYLMFKFDVS